MESDEKASVLQIHTEGVLIALTQRIANDSMFGRWWPSHLNAELDRLETRLNSNNPRKVCLDFEKTHRWSSRDLVGSHHKKAAVTSEYQIRDEIDAFREAIARHNVPPKRRLLARSQLRREHV